VKRAQELARFAPPDLPDPEDWRRWKRASRERLEAMLEAVTLAGSAEASPRRSSRATPPRGAAQLVEDAGTEAKLSQLKRLLKEQGFFDRADQRCSSLRSSRTLSSIS